MKKDLDNNNVVKNSGTPTPSASFEKKFHKVEQKLETEASKPVKKKRTKGQKILMIIAVIALGLALAPVFGTGIGVLIFGFCIFIPKVWNDEW